MRFPEMTVGRRMALGFALVIALGLVVAIVARIQLGELNGRIHALVEEELVKVEKVGEIRDNLNLMARASRNLLLIRDAAGRQTNRERIRAARAGNSEVTALLQKLFHRTESLQILERIQGLRTKYNSAIDEVETAALADDDAAARAALFDRAQPALEAYFGELTNLAALQKRFMDEVAAGAEADAAQMGLLLLVLAAAATAIGLFVSWLLTRSITRALGGEPAAAAQVAREIAVGNLTIDVPPNRGAPDSLMASMKRMHDALAAVVGQVRHGSQAVAAASAEIAQGNQDLSARTENQASSLEETAASMEQLGSTVRQNADNARQANQLAQSAREVAVEGGKVVDEVVATMHEIDDAGRRIADIIGVIDSIAFQTNILALNAAVEAARAGEHGRGFAVVASEVRQLAGRSAEAAKEIEQLITASGEKVRQGSRLADQAGATMNRAVDAIRHVTDLMGEINSASAEQSAGVDQVGEAVTQMDQVTQQNAAMVEEMAAAASSLRSQADDLVRAVAVFRIAGQRGPEVQGPETSASGSLHPRAPASRARAGEDFADAARRKANEVIGNARVKSESMVSMAQDRDRDSF